MAIGFCYQIDNCGIGSNRRITESTQAVICFIIRRECRIASWVVPSVDLDSGCSLASFIAQQLSLERLVPSQLGIAQLLHQHIDSYHDRRQESQGIVYLPNQTNNIPLSGI